MKPKRRTPKTERPSAGLLRTDPANARLHPQRNRELIRHSLETVGGFRSIAVDGDNIIRAGNGVFSEARRLGMPIRVVEAQAHELIAVRRRDLRGPRAVQAAILDNRSSELAAWDPEALEDLLDELDEAGASDLNGLGFTEEELAALGRATQMPADGSAGTAAGSGRKRREGAADFILGGYRFAISRCDYQRWLEEAKAQVGQEPDALVAEFKRRLRFSTGSACREPSESRLDV
jgi:hypothetical protein